MYHEELHVPLPPAESVPLLAYCNVSGNINWSYEIKFSELLKGEKVLSLLSSQIV
jgi:hypothetical protein